MSDKTLTPSIIYDDDNILVVDKPAGLTVDRASTNKTNSTLQDWIENHINRHAIAKHLIYNSSDFESRSGIVHRLDKETSGVLVVAKNKEAFVNLQAQFKNRGVVKKYLTLVTGKVEYSSGTINAPIGRNPYDTKKFGIFVGGRDAVTDYKTINNYQLSNKPNFNIKLSITNNLITYFSYLEVFPHTGRTHQIRVHLKYINHPVVGDILYGGRKNMQFDKTFCSRMFLHAFSLKIKHPKTGEDLEFKSELPKELQEVLDTLKV